MLQVGIKNSTEVKDFLTGQSKGMGQVAERAAIDMTLAASGYAQAQAEISPRMRTRLYRNSIHPEIERLGGFKVNGLIASNVRYAPYLEAGTPPHVIRPKNKKALFWIGARHPLKKVSHPGTRAYHVLQNAVKKAADNAQLFVNKALKYFKVVA